VASELLARKVQNSRKSDFTHSGTVAASLSPMGVLGKQKMRTDVANRARKATKQNANLQKVSGRTNSKMPILRLKALIPNLTQTDHHSDSIGG
jgi:hypothetical protein